MRIERLAREKAFEAVPDDCVIVTVAGNGRLWCKEYGNISHVNMGERIATLDDGTPVELHHFMGSTAMVDNLYNEANIDAYRDELFRQFYKEIRAELWAEDTRQKKAVDDEKMEIANAMEAIGIARAQKAEKEARENALRQQAAREAKKRFRALAGLPDQI
jgi:hypothetical protein